MSQNLNGWQRLWVLYSLISIIPFGYFVFVNLRTVKDIPHDSAYYSRMSDENKQKLILEPSNNKEANFERAVASVELPNGHILLFNNDYNDTVVEQVGKNYFDILKEESAKRNLLLVVKNIFAWLSLNFIIYAVGFGISWAIKGFKN
jgi:hypothetical protein